MSSCGYRTLAMAVVLIVTGSARSEGQVVTRPQIIRVDHDVLTDSATAGYPRFFRPQLTRFTDDAPPSVREVFTIDWIPPSAGAPIGTLVTFEYRQTFSDAIKFLSIKYPFLVKGERTARFEIAGEARRLGGPVQAWRARVVWSGRLMAERTSPSWR